MRRKFKFLDQVFEILQTGHGARTELAIGDHDGDVVLTPTGGGHYTIEARGTTVPLVIARKGETAYIHAGGEAWTVEEVIALGGVDESDHGADVLYAPMPGTVISLKTMPGRAVEKGEPLIVIESMKLETTIKSPRSGTVAETPLDDGATFDKGAVLVRLEPEGN